MRENPRENERLLTEISSKYIEYPIVTRPPLVKKPTNLKLEGDFYSTTEKAENFIQYLISARPVLTKRPTTLKLDGDMDTKTENREKFIPFEITKRPPLCKKFTNLHLEGDLNIVTEKQEQFVRYEVQKRPPLTKKHTNLGIEGEFNMIPEYRREYVEYYKPERPKLSLPVNNLKTDGFYDVVSDVSKSVEQQIHPQIPNLRGEEHHDVVLRPRLGRTRENSFIRSEGPMQTETESRTQFIEKPSSKNEPVKVTNNLQLEGRIDLNPEYRNAYIDYKDTSSAPRTRRSRRAQENLRTEGKMDVTPEYKSSYIDFPRRRPHVKRPENSLSSEGELDHMTEKNEKYVPFTNVPRTGPLKRDPELKLEGNIECQPEYRKAYIDYLIRERVERKHRPLDNLGRQSKRIIEDEPIQKTANQPKIEPATEEKPKSGQPKRPKSTRNRSLSQIETSVFGPKLPLPEDRRRASSRTSSPHGSSSSRRRSRTLPRTQNVSNSSDSDAPSRKYKTFGKPVLVENLASRSTTPVLPLIDVSAKNKWMRDSSIESSSAFVVLDKNVKRDKWPHW